MDESLAPVTDMSVGSWIAPRLGPFGGDVGSNVPRGYAAYARVLHPAGDAQARWSTVCSATGRVAHALMQWEDITGPVWRGGDPEKGNLAPEALEGLCEVLGHHTPSDVACFFAVWEGYGWGDATPASSIAIAAKPPAAAPIAEALPPVLPPKVVNGPRMHRPNRCYFLFTGPLRASLTLGRWPLPDWFIPQSPNVVFPADQSWYVATEIDFDSTLVGGSERLVSDLLAQPGLEAWPIGQDDSLARDGDEINGPW